MALLFAMLNAHILLVKHHKLKQPLPLERRRQILIRSITGVIPYAIATAVAAISPYVTIAICAALGVFYAFPISSGGAARPAHPRHHAPSTRRQFSHAINDSSRSSNPAAASASSSRGVPATSPSAAGIVAPS